MTGIDLTHFHYQQVSEITGMNRIFEITEITCIILFVCGEEKKLKVARREIEDILSRALSLKN